LNRLITLIAVALAAFAAADVAHETLGHGGMCAALGGHVITVSTTFENCSIRSWIIDGAGPVAGIVMALSFWLWLAAAPPKAAAARAFLCLGFAFAAFWNFGYLIKSGLTDQGDWAFVIKGLEPASVWHAGIAIAGLALYIASIRVLARLLVRHLASTDAGAQTPLAFALTAFVAAIALACAAAAFDPRGTGTIVSDALPSSVGAVGLPLAGSLLQRAAPGLRLAVPTSPAWIVIGFAVAGAFVGLLGPGLRL
jgi:hypothetical protein